MNLKAGTAKCAPEKGEFKIKGGNMLMQTDDLPTFYLHEDFVNAKPVLECFHKAKGSTPGVDEFDFKMMPDTAEHMVDVWMLEQLKVHPQRVQNPDKAKLHIVGFPIFNSYAGGRFWGCGSHETRIAQLVDKMTSNKYYKKKQGADFVVIATAPDALRVFTEPLINLAKKGKVIVATADKNYPSVEPFQKKVVIPYKSMHPIEKNAWNGTIPKTADRSISFMFHGDVKKGKRSVLGLIAKGLAESDIQDHNFQKTGMNAMKKLVENSANTYLKSKFCLVAEGSTPTSRRLFDALGSGCVPIMLGGEEGIRRNLPFQKTIDWSQIVFYGGNLGCVGQNYAGEEAFLKEFLERPAEEIDAMRERGAKVFREALSYRGPGIVDALLREIEI